MAGLFVLLIVLLLIGSIIFYILDKDNDYYSDIVILFSGIILFLFIITIPISRLDSKTNVNEYIALQETLDYNRTQRSEFTSIERHPLMEHVVLSNKNIASWKTKGDKWYQNKWYYHPSTKIIEYIK